MRVLNCLVVCEESQTVVTELRLLGHNAYSCDLQDCSGGHPEWHIQGDCLQYINGGGNFVTSDGMAHIAPERWDLIIAHPPCTFLSNAGTRHFSLKCTPPQKVANRWEERARAAVFFMQCIYANCDHVAVENPIGFMNKSYRKPDQIIQPYYFADSDEDVENYQMKTTCLWLRGLPKLERTTFLEKPKPVYVSLRKNGRTKNVYFTENDGKIAGIVHRGNVQASRSKTFPNVAKQMAIQWSEYVINEIERKEENIEALRNQTGNP